MALGDAKSGCNVDPTLHPDSRLAFRRPGRQTHGAHRTQGIIFADVARLDDWWFKYTKEQGQKKTAEIQNLTVGSLLITIITFLICL